MSASFLVTSLLVTPIVMPVEDFGKRCFDSQWKLW
jgi:hypothetical protein